jgi:hypothetical protein
MTLPAQPRLLDDVVDRRQREASLANEMRGGIDDLSAAVSHEGHIRTGRSERQAPKRKLVQVVVV